MNLLSAILEFTICGRTDMVKLMALSFVDNALKEFIYDGVAFFNISKWWVYSAPGEKG
jgi:hypothetical protein